MNVPIAAKLSRMKIVKCVFLATIIFVANAHSRIIPSTIGLLLMPIVVNAAKSDVAIVFIFVTTALTKETLPMFIVKNAVPQRFKAYVAGIIVGPIAKNTEKKLVINVASATPIEFIQTNTLDEKKIIKNFVSENKICRSFSEHFFLIQQTWKLGKLF